MSSPIGGFSYKVDADVSAAQAALRRLVQSSQQSAQQIQAAFASTRIGVNTAQTQQAAQQVARQVRQIQKAATLTIRADTGEAERGLAQLESRARTIGNTRVNLTVHTNAGQAEQAIDRLGASLRRAGAGERINVNVRADSVQQADNAVRRLTDDINAAKAAGARIAVNVQTNQQAGGFAREVGRGFLQQATPGLATGAAAAIGVVTAQAVTGLARSMVEGAAAGVRYNAALQDSAVQMTVFLGSAEATTVAMGRLQKIAEETPFSFAEINESAASFSQIAGGNIDRLERLVTLATQLAAVNPSAATGGGLGGATLALREALSGDPTSIVERFRVSRAQVQALKDAGLAGEALAVALVKAAGGSAQLVDAMSDTFTGRLAKAGEIMDKLAGLATRPLFEGLNAGLERFNTIFGNAGPKLERLALILGVLGTGAAAGGIGGPAGAGTGAGVAAIGLATGAISSTPPAKPSTTLSEGERARQRQIEAAQAEATRAAAAATKQEADLKKIEAQLERNAAAARVITERYQEQLRPLEAQQRALDGQIAAAEAQGRAIDARARDAEGPTETRAQLAAAAVVLEHEQELLDIRHQRAEITEQIATAEEAIANRAAEAQIRAAEAGLRAARDAATEQRQARQDALDALREEVRENQEARRDALDGLREEIRGRQELRQTALDGLRDLISAQQEQRRDALEGIQDEIRARREAYDVAREAAQDAAREAQEAFEDERREADSAHSAIMDNYRDRIDSLREQLQVRRENTAAERELAAFDAAERARSRQERLQDAARAIRGARTGRDLRDAAINFQRTRLDVAADAKREEIQQRIAREREAEEKRREQIQEKINRLEREARAEDRAYQREKDAREEQFREQQRVEQQALREEERAERERRRIEDQQVREQQRADRDADKAAQKELREAERVAREADREDQRQIRAQEQADRLAQREEERQIRAEEKAAREADRAEERALREAERGIQAARDQLAERQAAQEDARVQAQLGRLRESAELQDRILTNREAALDAVDVTAKAQAAADKIRNDAQLGALRDRKSLLDDEYNAIQRNLQAALEPIEREGKLLAIARDQAKQLLEQLQGVADAAKKAAEEAEKIPEAFQSFAPRDADDTSGFVGLTEAGPIGFTGARGSNRQVASGLGTAIGNAIQNGITDVLKGTPEKIVADLTTGLTRALGQGTAAIGAFEAWASAQIEAYFKKWGIASPSTVMIEAAGEIGAGFVEGIAAQHEAAKQAIADLFQASWVGGAETIDAIINEIVIRFSGTEEYSLPPRLEATAPTIGASIATTFDQAWAQGGAAGVDAVLDEIGKHWETVGDQIDSYRNRAEVERAITNLFGPNVLDRAFRNVERNFEIYGNNMAVAFIDGWTAQMSSWQPYVPAASYGGGYSGGGSAGSSSGSFGGGGSSFQEVLPGTEDITRYLESYGHYPGSNSYSLEFQRLVDEIYNQGLRPPSDMVVTGRRYGGPFDMGRPYLLHKDEIMVPSAAGEVLPPEFLSGVKAMAGRTGAWSGGGYGAPQVSINIGSGAVQITGAGDIGLDNPALEAFGRRVVEDLVSVLHAAKRHTPGRVNPLLPGAR